MALRLAIPILAIAAVAGAWRAPRHESGAPMLAPCVSPGSQPESLNVTSALDRDREMRAIASARSRVERRGDTLRFRLNSGATRNFIDCTLSWDNYVRYVYEGSGPKALGHIVFVTTGEPSNWFWLDEHRDTLHILHSLPHYNADSTLLVIANSDLESGYTTNALEVWRVSGTGLAREFGLVGGDYGFVVSGFLGDTIIKLRITKMLANLAEDSIPASLVRRSRGWSLHLAAREP